MTTLTAWRTDVAAVVTAALGVTCQPGWTGNPEPNTAMMQWGDPWLSYDPLDGATFCKPAVRADVWVVTSSADQLGAQADLEAFQPLLQTIGGTALAGGGKCPGVFHVNPPADLFENSTLLVARAELWPVVITLT